MGDMKWLRKTLTQKSSSPRQAWLDIEVKALFSFVALSPGSI
jgi:hypothetical protein